MVPNMAEPSGEFGPERDEERSVSSGTSDQCSRADLSTSNATSTSAQEMLEEKERMFQTESRQVTRLKRVVLLIMLLAGVAVSTTVYFITKNAEERDFEANFEGAGEKLLATFHDIAQARLGAISSLTVAATAHGLDHDEAWPFMTLSWFQQRALTTRSLSGALLITLNPLVTADIRKQWENYSYYSEDSKWHDQGMTYQKELNYSQFGLSFDARHVIQRTTLDPDLKLTGLANHIFTLDDKGDAIIDRSKGPYLPSWETSPVFIRTLVNRNLLTDPEASRPANTSINTASVVFGGYEFAPDDLGKGDEPPETKLYTTLLSIAKKRPFPYITSPLTRVYVPVFDTFEEKTKKPVALMTALIRWESYFVGVLPDQIRGINMVLDNQCGDVYTFKINGHEPDPVGVGDYHDPKFDYLSLMSSFADVDTVDDGSPDGIPLSHHHCVYQMTSYPSQLMLDDFSSNLPALITFAVAMVFAFTFVMFLIYDRLVERRQNLVLQRAEQTTAIVQSLFPKDVADKLIQESQENDPLASKTQRLNKFLSGDDQGTKTIADLFPECTVLFADIAGFTAWSSTRDPSQVFHLLESIYNAFDEIAKVRKVFKVETVGDCYVAVTGLPDPQPNHAVIMARFASECLIKMKEVTRKLETTLGPDTGELDTRIGLHSGPVTAGVLRGDKSRFQLFGDTVNTASRMESTGLRGKIQISQDTANVLVLANKAHWLSPREDEVNAKGKGVLRTYWLDLRSGNRVASSTASSGIHDTSSANDVDPEDVVQVTEESEYMIRKNRMVGWMTELLCDYLKQILAKRTESNMLSAEDFDMPDDLIAIDEVVEAVTLPRFDAKDHAQDRDRRDIEVDHIVSDQIREFVFIIASMYRDNPFHNFEHACHVTMSVSKHLKRIVTPELDMNDDEMKACSKDKGAALALLHDYTHGINSDPLTHFAIVFSGLIHDVDHRGISNMQLAKEEPAIAVHFKQKSLAEQNSLEIAWTLLMSDQFRELRRCLFVTKEEFVRFRQVIVNVVMATDIFDKELNALRKARWEKAFSEESLPGVDKNILRATIVIEHIIQASDVAHTMQHWHVYRKWNSLLFKELTLAFRSGRMAVDPATFWYKGELGFFDTYVIPLAKKLKDCKVFGVNSDECLNYAVRNRAEWEARGEEAVAELVRECADLEGPTFEEQRFF